VDAGARRPPGRHRRLELGRAVLPDPEKSSPNRRRQPDLGDHRAGREIGYSHLEKLHNLEQLPPDGFEVVCFPVKVHRASAGWTRAAVILPG
jgi:kynurenine formamidase